LCVRLECDTPSVAQAYNILDYCYIFYQLYILRMASYLMPLAQSVKRKFKTCEQKTEWGAKKMLKKFGCETVV